MSINSELTTIVDDLFLSPELVALVGGAISTSFKQNWGDLSIPSVALAHDQGRVRQYGAIVRRTLHVYCYAASFKEAADIYDLVREHLSPADSSPRTISCEVRQLFQDDTPLEMFSEEHCTYGYRGTFAYTTVR